MTNRARVIFLFALIVAFLAPSGLARDDQILYGSERVLVPFLLEAYSVEIVPTRDGGFFVFWETGPAARSPDGPLEVVKIQGARFSRQGEQEGSEFEVADCTVGHESENSQDNNCRLLDARRRPDGSVLALWIQGRAGRDGNDWSDSYVTQISEDMPPAISELFVEGEGPWDNSFLRTYSTAGLVNFSGGEFTVAHDNRSEQTAVDEELELVFGRAFGESGSAGTAFQINDLEQMGELAGDYYPTRSPAVSEESAGELMVVWNRGSEASYWQAWPPFSVQGRLLRADGSPVGDQFLISSSTTNHDQDQEVATDGQGNFLVTWESGGSPWDGGDGSDKGIRARVVTGTGPATPEFQVNSYTHSKQHDPDVGSLDGIDFVVAWTSIGSSASDTDGRSIQGRRIAVSGSPLGDEFQINQKILGDQYRVQLARLTGGEILATWWSQTAEGFELRGRTFQFGLFGDGFESGDSSGWTASTD